MTQWDSLETAAALRALSLPAPTDARSISRRRFLQLSAAAAGATTALPSWFDDVAAAATPIGPNDGVLVVVLMAGGNDGLNTVVPTGDGHYYDHRGDLAIAESAALPLVSGVGLHPNLRSLHARYRAGRVAVVRGVGDVDPDMSHFTAMARWMHGHANSMGTASGWLGRWLDGYARADDLAAVVVGESVPLALVGRARKAVALPARGVDAITAGTGEAWVQRAVDCLRAMGAGPTGNGAWADALGAATAKSVDLADTVKPLYASELPAGTLVGELELAARLVNADLGVRVIHVQYGDFDHHSNQPGAHDARMAELDAGLDRFFATLSPAFANRTTVLTLSEFGRRPEANASNGTDHGEASDLLVIGAGSGVRGGVYGHGVDLTHLSDHGCPVAHVDFRSVYATVLGRWLGADAGEVLGGSFGDVGFLRAPAP
jgi:uncharacterized protein (DUF1501 family)